MFGNKANKLLEIKDIVNVPSFITFDIYGMTDVLNNKFDKEFLESKINNLDKNKSYSIRSSPEFSMPGLCDTFLNVKYSDIPLYVQKVLESYNNPRALQYMRIKKIHSHNSGIIIQEMITPKYAGVFMTVDPKTNKDYFGEYVIDSTGDKLMSGEENGINITTIPFHILNELIEIGKILEQKYNCSQEIEFAYEESNLWILQTRNLKINPITEIKEIPVPEGYEVIGTISTTANYCDWFDKSQILFLEKAIIPLDLYKYQCVICKNGGLSSHLSMLCMQNNIMFITGYNGSKEYEMYFINGLKGEIYGSNL